jgi:hypothetical protein
MRQLSLNELFADYITGKINRADFESSIYLYLVYNQEKTCLVKWKRDEYEDYVSWFYPRLRKAIDSYNETGASFEAFMGKFLTVSSKEFRVRITANSVTEYSAWSARIPEMYAREEAPVYLQKDNENVIEQLIIDKKGRRNTKRMLALVLKCYYYVSEDFAEKIAPKIGIDSKELSELLGKIRKIRQEKDDAIYNMKERVYCQFYRCIVYEKKLSFFQENTMAYNRLKSRLEKARRRLERMRKRITSMRKDATNRQIAEIIGISKGTVDASLHRLRTKWEKMSKKSGLN